MRLQADFRIGAEARANTVGDRRKWIVVRRARTVSRVFEAELVYVKMGNRGQDTANANRPPHKRPKSQGSTKGEERGLSRTPKPALKKQRKSRSPRMSGMMSVYRSEKIASQFRNRQHLSRGDEVGRGSPVTVVVFANWRAIEDLAT